MSYGPLEGTSFTYKYYWKDVPCETKANFICEYNGDFLGFHKLSNLILDKALVVEFNSMTLTVCLSICKAHNEPIHVAFILEQTCICAKGKLIVLED